MSEIPARISIGDQGILNEAASPDLSAIWIDRDLGWLEFNERVLAEALDERTPLLERVKFLAIFSSNLDEFFMKRIAVLREELTPERLALLAQIREKLQPSLHKQSACFRDRITPELAHNGVTLARWHDLTDEQKAEATDYFEEQVSPAMTPLVIDPGHPFPFLSNLSTSLVFTLRDPEHGDSRIARVKVPGVLKQWVPLKTASGRLLVPLYEIIRANLDRLYQGMEISAVTLFRLTRDADVPLEDEDDDSPLRELVEEQVRQRRYEPAVRLEFALGADPGIRKMLCERFQLSDVDVYDCEEELDYSSLFEIAFLDLPALRDSPWTPLVPQAFADADPDVFALIRQRDVLVHHPYESFDATVEHFVAAAADDPQTVAIKMTIYRIGDKTPFVRSLIRAAESGKQVAVLFEIQARFDEERNLQSAAQLEAAGAHVTYGVRGLKTHAKTVLVVRKEATGLKSYVHIGTGNYHVRTARLYVDFGLFTCNPAITRDAVQLFHYLTGHSKVPAYQSLLVAPATMRPRFLEMIHREIENHREGRPARIVAKMNQLEDPDLIVALSHAAQAGVPVDLIIRGFCCLRPGVTGKTEGVRVRSIIGRFLEHSRVFHFAAGSAKPEEGEFYIGSADWMHRNLSGRVEVITPIFAEPLKARLWEVLQICLSDHRQAWILNTDGSYTQLQPDVPGDGPGHVGTHHVLMEMTRKENGND